MLEATCMMRLANSSKENTTEQIISLVVSKITMHQPRLPRLHFSFGYSFQSCFQIQGGKEDGINCLQTSCYQAVKGSLHTY